ncbi:MAG: response regulator [Hyphomonadaceae bacterium]
MSVSMSRRRIAVVDVSRHVRGMICDVLRNAGFMDTLQAANSDELLQLVEQSRPGIVVMPAAFPELSGLAFTRRIRNGYNFVPREMSIILTTNAPTKSFLEATREIGVDEVVVLPFTAQSLLTRIRSVIERPRPFVDCAVYVGPCRRRRMLQDYKGPKRRMEDPVEETNAGSLWEGETNRAAVRLCVQKISEFGELLGPDNRHKLRQIYNSVMQIETLSSQKDDEALGAAARSLGRYIEAVGIAGQLAQDVVTTHIDAMHTLCTLADIGDEQRHEVIAGLERVVQRKLAADNSFAG